MSMCHCTGARSVPGRSCREARCGKEHTCESSARPRGGVPRPRVPGRADTEASCITADVLPAAGFLWPAP